jgi:phospholipid/cholesterol/gamma-HCH transport system substrate-binding protein
MTRFRPVESLKRAWSIPGMGRDMAAIAFMVTAAVVTAVVIMSNLATGLPWQSHSAVHVEFAAVPGVNPEAGSPVTMAGVDVGTITGARPTDHGTAVLDLDLSGTPTIYSNARAVLRPKNPLNEMSVELNPGGPPGHPLGSDDVIPVSQTSRPIQADEVLQHLDGQAQAALTDLLSQSDVALARAPQDLAPGLQATSDTAVALRPVVTALDTRRQRISQLVTAMSQIASALGDNTDRTARLADGTQQTLDALASNDASVRTSLAQLPGLSGSLRDALNRTQGLTRQLNPTLDDLDRASEKLPKALDRLRKTAGPLQDTVDAAAPVVDKARPVVRDLRPLSRNVDDALGDLLPVTHHLQLNTQLVVSYLTEIRAFMYNTKSVFSNGDASGTQIRAHVVAPPGGGVVPQHDGFVPDKSINPHPHGGK